MREIKFRGKRSDEGDWIYGYYRKWPDGKHAIIVDNSFYNVSGYEVDPATVGQFTGLKDKNGKEIYEGDIVHRNKIYQSQFGNPVVYLGNYIDDDLKYNDEDIELYGVYIELKDGNRAGMGQYHMGLFEVIGNIHDKRGEAD